MKSHGYKQKQDWKRSLLFRIAMEELVEGAQELLKVKVINSKDKIYKLAVRVRDTEREYIVHAIIQLVPPAANDGYLWKLLNLEWEEVKK